MKNGALFGRMVSATSGALGEVLSEFTPKIRGNGARRISHFGREAAAKLSGFCPCRASISFQLSPKSALQSSYSSW
jgi:hypothetical protein